MTRRLDIAALGLWLVAGDVCPQSLLAREPVDVSTFAAAPAFVSPTLSPDGTRVAFISQAHGEQRLLLRRLVDGDTRGLLAREPDRERLRWCDWSGNERLVCGTAVFARTRGVAHVETGLVTVAADGSGERRLLRASVDAIRDRVIDLLPHDDSRVLVEHDETGSGLPDVSRLDLRTDKLRAVVRGRAPIRSWMTDGRGLVRLGLGYDGGDASLFARAAEGDEWNLVMRQSLRELGAYAPLAFGRDPGDLYVLKLHAGRYALFHVDLDRRAALSLMFSHPEFDVTGPVVLDPVTRDLLAVRYVGDRLRQHFFDAREQAVQQRLDALLPDRVNVVIDRAISGRRRLVRSFADASADALYLFDSSSGALEHVLDAYPGLADVHLGRKLVLGYHARDGQMIPAYLTVPPGVVATGLPAIVLPHGGPEMRDEWGFDPLVQFLATRGYAVLQMNFRGSSGFGAAFLAAGAGQWGGVIHNDITDGVHWLVRQGIADPARICIVGSSFGGYAALLGATREPGLYRCAASFAGVADLVALVQGKDRFQYADVWRERVGSDEWRLTTMSPITYAAQADVPILLAHGDQDVVVPLRQSRRMARALAQAGKAHEYLELKGCDHDLTPERCRLAFYQQLERFLATQLSSP